MDPQIQASQSPTDAHSGLNERDRFLINAMLRTNASWIVTTHNAHLVKIEPIGKALHADAVPLWWIRYARANEIELSL